MVALAPAGGWAEDDETFRETLAFQLTLQEQVEQAAPFADQIVATPEGRRRVTEFIASSFEHIPAALLAHQLRGVAACDAAERLVAYALRKGWRLDAARITCPVRIVWGAADRILPWPQAAARFREDWLPQADWVVLDGHCPQLDVPLETGELILGFHPTVS